MNILREILKFKADINITDANGWTPLHKACELGNIEIVQFLLRNGADIFKFSNKKYYPIHIAALNNHPGVISSLIDFCDKIETKTEPEEIKKEDEIIKDDEIIKEDKINQEDNNNLINFDKIALLSVNSFI